MQPSHPRSPRSHPSVPLAAAMVLLCGTAAAVAQPNAARFGREGTVKVRMPRSATMPARSAGSLVAQYDTFSIYEVPANAIPAGAEVNADENRILLNSGALDTSTPEVKALQRPRGEFTGKEMHLVQFAGPVQPAWYEQLAQTGVEIVTYIPTNAYLVYGDSKQLASLQAMAARDAHVQWEGPYTAAYRLDPTAVAMMNDPKHTTATNQLFAVQLVQDAAANKVTLALVETLRSGEVVRSETSLNYYNVIAPIPPVLLATLAARPDVVSIQPYVMPTLQDERQDQIVAGNLTGNLPNPPGYLAWLATQGFTQAQFTASNFAVDVSDSGIDNATTSPNHFGLYLGGVVPGTSRIIYNRLIGTPHSGSTLQGCDGHGTLNTHVVLGWDNSAGFPFADSSGYHYGLGVCPFTKAGSSVIFDPTSFTSPNYANLQSQAYNNGARISTNSWGAAVAGAYNTDAQSYDALVRDAQPTGSTFPVAGNQEMVIVFAADNAGPGSGSVGAPGTGKNIFSIGAAENVQAFGGSDGCGEADTLADSANDIATFSGRGPCQDGRKKPDICAPGVHVSGGVGQLSLTGPTGTGTALACYNGVQVCGGVSSIFYPPGQQFYTASSGTSHSTPCVAGGAALTRQWFINHSLTPPSPAMTKAFLMNSARYMNGTGANDSLYSNNQGMGEMNLGEAFNRASTPTLLRDELPADMFTASGQARVFTGNIADSSKPFRITVAWTDAPGATSGSAAKNNLDLTVTIGGNTYKGNVFSGANSVTGGSADTLDNVESVFLPAGLSGGVTVTVTGANINSDGVPNVGGALDQDFAIVGYNFVAGNPTPSGACCTGPTSCSIQTQAACAQLGGSYGGDNSSCPSGVIQSGPPQTYISSNVPIPIADVATSTSTLNIASSAVVYNITCNLSLTHTFDGDLVLTLVAPGGQSVIMSSRNGSSGDNYTNTTFDDSAATLITAGTPPYTGSFRPSPGTMASLQGVPINGTWTLRIDDQAAQDVGTLTAWSVTITPGSLPTCNFCYPNCDGSTTPPVLNVLDFACFLNRYASGDTYANCDHSTTPPVLNVLDFACFLNSYATGCQ